MDIIEAIEVLRIEGWVAAADRLQVLALEARLQIRIRELEARYNELIDRGKLCDRCKDSPIAGVFFCDYGCT